MAKRLFVAGERIQRPALPGRWYENVTICGEAYELWDYGWYMVDAVATCRRWTADGIVTEPAVDFTFVKRLRDAIRENYNHSLGIEAGDRLATLEGIRGFVAAVERIDGAFR
jgi:hypothetical protein